MRRHAVSIILVAVLTSVPVALTGGGAMADLAVGGEHPAAAVLVAPLVEALAAELEDEPGFLALDPATDGSGRLVALFEGAAPADLPSDLVPEGWTLVAEERVRFEPLGPLGIEKLVELDQPPVPEDSVGIGPGSTILIFPGHATFDEASLCSAAFVFQDDDTGKVYLGTAGHCFVPTTERVSVCVASCIGGLTGVSSAALGVYPGNTRDIGAPTGHPVAYFRGTGVGNDFGIVEIPRSLWGEIRTDMPVWGGPATSDVSRRVQFGDVVVHYGNGVGMGEVFPTKGRGGIGAGANAQRWLANTPAASGDSGSALNIATVGAPGVVEGEWAGGVLTHLVIGSSGVVAGTTMERSVQMAQQEGGFNLRLISDPSEIVMPTELSFTEDSADSGRYLDDVLIEARLVDADGDPIAGEDVLFEVEDTDLSWSATTDGDGVAGDTIRLDARPDAYTLRATFAGDDDVRRAEASAAFVIERRDTDMALEVEGRGVDRVLEATLTHAGGDTPVAGRTVEFYADGERIGSAATDSDGVATLQPPPRYRGGRFEFAAVFDGDDFYEGATGSAQT